MSFRWRVVFLINLFFCFFLAIFFSGIKMKTVSFSEQPAQFNSIQKDFFNPLKKFFAFQDSTVSDLYNYALTEEQKNALEKAFNENKELLSRALFFLPKLTSNCDKNLSLKITNFSSFLNFLKTLCSKKIVINLMDEEKRQYISNAQLQSFLISQLKIKTKTKLEAILDKIKAQLMWKFLKTKDWDRLQVTDPKWANINFADLKKQKNFNFEQLLPQQKEAITQLVKKITELNVESSWKTVLNQEIFPKKTTKKTTNSSSNGLFIGLGVGGAVLLMAIGTGFYFYKKIKKKQKNV